MKNKQENFLSNPGAERRRKKAAEEGRIGISDWRGTLHAHTGTEARPDEMPDEIIGKRQGSNCGRIPLAVLADFHAREMKNEFLAITDHSRDGAGAVSAAKIADWFTGLYLSNDKWLRDNLGKGGSELAPEDMEKIRQIAEEKAKELSGYGDERLERVLKEIDRLQPEMPIRLLKGTEVNITPDGKFDTEKIGKGDFDVVVASIHPDLDRRRLEPIISDPARYSRLLLKGIKNKKTNIIGHIGYGLGRDITENLHWREIARAAIKNKVAVEINLQSLLKCINDRMLDYARYDKADDPDSYLGDLKKELPSRVPLFGNEKIKNVLKPYFKKGLKIAMNTDEHSSKFISAGEDGKHEFKPRDFRFWRCLKVVENYFNGLFRELDIRSENIINTYSREELNEFLKK